MVLNKIVNLELRNSFLWSHHLVSTLVFMTLWFYHVDQVHFSRRIIFSLYVDDIIMIGDDVSGINKLKLHLAKKFEIEYLYFLHYFLEIEVAYTPDIISQFKYIVNIL